MPTRRSLHLFVVFVAVVLVLSACDAFGQILPRPTPTPPPPTPTSARVLPSTATSTPVPPTPTVVITATVGFTPTEPLTGTVTPTATVASILKVGQPARVVAAEGLNIREKAAAQSKKLGRFAAGALVTVEDGPILADGYRWWLVSDRGDQKGWVAEASQEGEIWLSSRLGDPRPVVRSVRKGDAVVVTSTSPLSLRFQAGATAVVDRQVKAGSRFTARDGPIDADGARWWLLVDKDGREGWAAEGRPDERWLTPME